VIRGDLTPECAADVRAVLEAPGKKAGPEDDRTEAQRFHDALQLACAREPRVCRFRWFDLATGACRPMSIAQSTSKERAKSVVDCAIDMLRDGAAGER
jgi:hypothetical protein